MIDDLVFDSYIIDALMPDLVGHDKRPAAFVVYLCLWRKTNGDESKPVRISHQSIAQATGLSRSTVQTSLAWLQRRGLVETKRTKPTSTPQHVVKRPWRARVAKVRGIGGSTKG